MSHANGLVKLIDGSIKYFEYNGTSDFVSLNYMILMMK